MPWVKVWTKKRIVYQKQTLGRHPSDSYPVTACYESEKVAIFAARAGSAPQPPSEVVYGS